MKPTLLCAVAYSYFWYEYARHQNSEARSSSPSLLKKSDDRSLRLNDQPKAKSGTGKKPTAAPFGARKTTKAKKNPLFEANAKNFGIGALLCHRLSIGIHSDWFAGQVIRPQTDLTRFVKWPEYVRSKGKWSFYNNVSRSHRPVLAHTG